MSELENQGICMIGIAEIERAQVALEGVVRITPMNYSVSLSEVAGSDVFLKLEQQQFTGSFKLRGASNAVSNLDKVEKLRGVVGVSTGNHGRGLAHAAKKAGVRCVICMSELVPQVKIDGIRSEGAEIRIIGRSRDEAEIEAERLVKDEGMVMVPPFDHPDIITGQGTLGLDAIAQVPDMETAIVPLSGGGLMSGVATALKARNPDIRIVGVTMERGAAMYECIKAGQYVEVEELPTLADSLGGGIGANNQYTFNIVRGLVDEYVLVSETEIAEAIRHAYWKERQVLEGSGSVAIAAVLSGKLKPKGKTVLFCCGGNIDMSVHHRIISGEDVDVTKEVKS